MRLMCSVYCLLEFALEEPPTPNPVCFAQTAAVNGMLRSKLSQGYVGGNMECRAAMYPKIFRQRSPTLHKEDKLDLGHQLPDILAVCL